MNPDVINVFKEDDGWFVRAAEKYGPYSRDLAEQFARGLAFAMRTSGRPAKIVFGENGDPPAPGDRP